MRRQNKKEKEIHQHSFNTTNQVVKPKMRNYLNSYCVIKKMTERQIKRQSQDHQLQNIEDIDAPIKNPGRLPDNQCIEGNTLRQQGKLFIMEKSPPRPNKRKSTTIDRI